MKKAFTLAEVLITLGIIGIVAAMTIPSITAKYSKRKVEVGLSKFYSVMTQAIKMSEIDNGSVKYWDYPETDGDASYKWFNKYLHPYMKVISECTPDVNCEARYDEKMWNAYFGLPDGIAFAVFRDSNVSFEVYINDGAKPKVGRNVFRFMFHPTRFQSPFMPDTYIEWVEGIPVGFHDISDRNALWATCNKFPQRCAGLIMHDGWKIKDDYPAKF